MENNENIFGEVISTYSRKQAIDDGLLVDISTTSEAKESGFKIPVVLARSVFDLIDGENFKGRLWDICFLATLSFRKATDKTLVPFVVKIGRANVKLWLVFNEYEGFTIMKPEDY